MQRVVVHIFSFFRKPLFHLLDYKKACNGFARLTRFHLLYLSSSPFPIWIRSWKSYDTPRGILSLTLLRDFLSKEAKMGLFPSWGLIAFIAVGLVVSNQGQISLYFLTHFGWTHLKHWLVLFRFIMFIRCRQFIHPSKIVCIWRDQDSIAVYLLAVFMRQSVLHSIIVHANSQYAKKVVYNVRDC